MMTAEVATPKPRITPTGRPFWDALRKGEVHIQRCGACSHYVFYPRTICPDCSSRDLAWTPLYGEPMVLLAPRKLDDASPRQLLERHPFIRFDRTQHTGRLVERTLKQLRARPQEFLELNAIESMVELVRAGLAVTIVPLLRGARWAQDAKLRVVELPRAEERQMALVQRRDAAQGAVVAAVVREFQAKLPA